MATMSFKEHNKQHDILGHEVFLLFFFIIRPSKDGTSLQPLDYLQGIINPIFAPLPIGTLLISIKANMISPV